MKIASSKAHSLTRRWLLAIGSLLLGNVMLLAGTSASAQTVPALAATLEHRSWMVDGVKREALIHVPASAHTQASPLLFVFHGHGGSMQSAASSFNFQTLWPEAIVVYMQGLATPAHLVDPTGNEAGWQAEPGDEGDRDLKFFDVVLASLRQQFSVDDARVFATGHSNGGGFTYLLWAARGDRFAAVAPSSTIIPRQSVSQLKPKPVLHVAGEKDQLVKFEYQQRVMVYLRKLNQSGDGQPWRQWCTLYPSKIKAPVVTCIHPGTHQFPAEAAATIVEFFRQYPRL